jgi:hypothetical protein
MLMSSEVLQDEKLPTSNLEWSVSNTSRYTGILTAANKIMLPQSRPRRYPFLFTSTCKSRDLPTAFEEGLKVTVLTL